MRIITSHSIEPNARSLYSSHSLWQMAYCYFSSHRRTATLMMEGKAGGASQSRPGPSISIILSQERQADFFYDEIKVHLCIEAIAWASSSISVIVVNYDLSSLSVIIRYHSQSSHFTMYVCMYVCMYVFMDVWIVDGWMDGWTGRRWSQDPTGAIEDEGCIPPSRGT